MRAAVLASSAAAAWSLPAAAPLIPALCRGLAIERRLEGRTGRVWLTFDDGPHPQGTPAVLDALSREAAHASFFLVGEQVERWPALAGEIVAAGHGFRHRNLLRVGPRAFAADLDRAVAVIADATGVAPALHRPPYGVYSLAALAEVRRRAWRPVLWSRWGHDWRARASSRSIAAEVTRGLSDGDVLLLHDADHYSAPGSWRATAAAVPRVLEEIARRGLATVGG